MCSNPVQDLAAYIVGIARIAKMRIEVPPVIAVATRWRYKEARLGDILLAQQVSLPDDLRPLNTLCRWWLSNSEMTPMQVFAYDTVWFRAEVSTVFGIPLNYADRHF